MLRVVRELTLKVLIRKNQIVHICGDGFNEIFYDYCTIYTNTESLDCTLKPMLYIYYMSVFFFFITVLIRGMIGSDLFLKDHFGISLG